MSGLVLSLKAEEKFLVNGALLINGSKRSQIRIGADGRYYSLICALRPLLVLEAKLLDVAVPSICFAAENKAAMLETSYARNTRIASSKPTRPITPPVSSRPVLSLVGQPG